MRGVIYARYSSDNQREESIEGQIRENTAYADNNGITIVGHYIDRALSDCRGKYDISILDIHAEATGEKAAIANAYDGKISVIFGTHTHVQTADERILPKGSGYITDVGMCGESGGILGMDTECVIERMRSKLPHKFKAASGAPIANCAIFTVDTKSGKTTDVKRFSF